MAMATSPAFFQSFSSTGPRSTSSEAIDDQLCEDDTVCSAFVMMPTVLPSSITEDNLSTRQSISSELEVGSLAEAGSVGTGLRSRPPRLQRRLFQSSSSSSQFSEDGYSWQVSRREDSKCSSEGGNTEAWEFKSALEAPIARLESLDKLEGSQCDEPPRLYRVRTPRQLSSDV